MSGLVRIEVGECPRCGACAETADGLEHYWCARGHGAVQYRLVDTYAMDARLAWEQ